MAELPKDLNAEDKWALFQKLMDSPAWSFFQKEIEDIGQDIMEKILDPDVPGGKLYTQRDLYVYQANMIRKITNIPDVIKQESDVFKSQKKGPEDGKV